MATQRIVRWDTGAVIWAGEAATVKDAIHTALVAGASLLSPAPSDTEGRIPTCGNGFHVVEPDRIEICMCGAYYFGPEEDTSEAAPRADTEGRIRALAQKWRERAAECTALADGAEDSPDSYDFIGEWRNTAQICTEHADELLAALEEPKE